MATTKTIWQPSEDNLKHSSMARFKDFAAKRSGRSFADYHQLYEWSVNPDTAADFWMALWSFLDLKASTQPIKAFEPVRESIFMYLHALLM
jgi:acetoacetyl-CoA synthetase